MARGWPSRAVLARGPLEAAALVRSPGAGADAGPARIRRSVDEAVRTLGNVTLLERPMRVSALLSAVRDGVRARERQVQIRGHMARARRTEESLRVADQRKDEFLATLGARAAQSARADPDGAAPAQARRACTTRVAASARRDGAAGRASRPSGRRPARGLAHHPRHGGRAARAGAISRPCSQPRSRRAVRSSRPRATSSRSTLPAEPITVAGDPVRLTQVFANLLNNAAKYTDAGGRDLAVAVGSDGIAPSCRVRDNGIGIPAVTPAERLRHVHAGRSHPIAAPRAGSASA